MYIQFYPALSPSPPQDCQSVAWKHSHRFECKIFKALHPNVLPNTVRLVMQLLLRRHNGALSDSAWKSFLDLESHMADFKKSKVQNEDNLTTWQTIELMSHAVVKYSGTKETVDNVQAMLARAMINTHTLTTPTLDPIGLCLDPRTALVNHSCTPNAHVVIDRGCLALRSLRSIPLDAEITLSYIDATTPTAKRSSELQSRYFFTCKCSSCSHLLTCGKPDPPQDPSFERATAAAFGLQSEAVSLQTLEAARKLEAALTALQAFPPYWQPYASIQHQAFLNALSCQIWPLALKYGVASAVHIEPLQYPLPWHPIRVVRIWILLRLMVQILGLLQEKDDAVQALKHLNLDWRNLSITLYRQLRDDVAKSHGTDSSLAAEVKAFGDGLGDPSPGSEQMTAEVALRFLAQQLDRMVIKV